MKKFLAACAVAVFATAAPAQSQWPDKPVRLIVPYPPGGNVDSAARIISERLGALFNQQFLVENKAGAGGLIAGEFVARSAPDGYTFFVGANGPILFAPLIFKRDVYHWKKDFVPVSSVSFTSLVLQVNPSTPYKTVAQLLEAGRNPAVKLSMASPGAGTTNHLLSELVQEQSGAKWLTVQYKGNAPATSDLLGGQVDFNFDQVSVALPFIKDGRTRALAVSSPKRLSQLPDVPTLQEAGFKGLTAETFTGVLAPKGTPPEIVKRLSDALQKLLAEKGVQDKFAGLGAESRGSPPEQFTEYLTAEDERWTPIIKKINITSQ
ncbi:MAG: tripartite tricarboxylate transporter substrate binding protein [Burkholderiaceae bacterium]|nr:tripartite tricarboxylate transporter substrate binding protein [Rhodoferax sp.]MCB2029191.1 tripartite tricarboxylate transporter substrate binding protein [Rhodoferax sp.]MCB2040413.1 tripartite tricarboxylate transporter substrate binding protein [Rhodoferax sp.]MCP5261956.1 tripartite tricarboxylate transporter substrate binding protein [Rhodoferax sp.]